MLHVRYISVKLREKSQEGTPENVRAVSLDLCDVNEGC